MPARNGRWSFLRALRILAALVLALFLALTPIWILDGLNVERYYALWQKPAPTWRGRIEIWHIASFRTYQGSVTNYLQARADAYCRRHAGVHIDVVGMTEKQYADRLARGAFPDAYSFALGLCYAEQLAALPLEAPAFRGTLRAAAYEDELLAVPYLMSGYFLAANPQLTARYLAPAPEMPDAAYLQSALDCNAKSAQLAMPPLLAARLGLVGTLASEAEFLSGKAALCALDARVLGGAVRDPSGGVLIEAKPFGPFTDQVFYLGASRYASEEQVAALADFALFLLSDDEQRGLATLGALPVTQVSDVVYAEARLEALNAAYLEPLVPDPFLYQRHKDALLGEAAAALAGDASARESFEKRLLLTLNG